MINEHQTIRIWKKTVKKLRLIHAETGEKQVAILERIVSKELQRLPLFTAEGNKESCRGRLNQQERPINNGTVVVDDPQHLFYELSAADKGIAIVE